MKATSGVSAATASRTPLLNSPIKIPQGQPKELAYQFKSQSEAGNVPFSTAKRVRSDIPRDGFNSLAKTGFAWKNPTVMK